MRWGLADNTPCFHTHPRTDVVDGHTIVFEAERCKPFLSNAAKHLFHAIIALSIDVDPQYKSSAILTTVPSYLFIYLLVHLYSATTISKQILQCALHSYKTIILIMYT